MQSNVWVCFIVTMHLFTAPVTFTVTASEFTDTKSDCERLAQREITIPHGQELLHVTPCLRIPSRNKA